MCLRSRRQRISCCSTNGVRTSSDRWTHCRRDCGRRCDCGAAGCTRTTRWHSFPTSRGPIVHGGAIATLADEALATVAFTLADAGQSTVTADLKIDFLRPAKPGRLVARASVRHRTKRLAFCEATIEHDGGEIVAEARAVIAFVRA